MFCESGMQQDDGRKVDKLRDREGLHPERGVRKPSEPFAQAGSGEADQEKDNCEPGGESCGGSGAGFIQSKSGKRSDDDGAICDGGEGEPFSSE